jgi:hypothetical protein
MSRAEWALAIIVGGVVIIAVVAMLGPGWAAVLDGQQSGGLYHYQGLLGGILAIVGAIIGAVFLNRQIRQAAQLETDRRAHDREAERAVLPLTLSEICGYAVASGRFSKSLLDQCQGGALPAEVVVEPDDIPRLAPERIEDLKQMIRHLDFADTPAFAKLISEIQVHDARGRDLTRAGRLMLTITLEERILDAAEIYARAEAFFEFARRETDTVPQVVRWGRVTAALFFMDILTGVLPNLDQRIAFASGGNPGAIVNR